MRTVRIDAFRMLVIAALTQHTVAAQESPTAYDGVDTMAVDE